MKTSHVLKATDVIGTRVVNADREDLGKIEQVMLSVDDGRVAYAVLSFGGFLGMGNKFFAVPWTALELHRDEDEDCFILDVAREKLQGAPGFPKDNWPDASVESLGVDIYEYYGVSRSQPAPPAGQGL